MVLGFWHLQVCSQFAVRLNSMCSRRPVPAHSRFVLDQMMEGFLDATSGSISIEGHSVHSEMEGIAGLVGICPQHDLLWDSLTGREHLLFYARLHAFTVSKHAPPSPLLQAVH